MRPLYVAGVAVTAVVIGWVALQSVRTHRQRSVAAFQLWTLRPGTPFATIEEQVRRQQRRSLTCRKVVGKHRSCEVQSDGIPTTGVPGTLHVIVDSADRVVLVQFRASDVYPLNRVQARRIAAEWEDEVRAVTAEWSAVSGEMETLPASQAGGGSVTRWLSANHLWWASRRRGPGDTATAAVTLADAEGLGRVLSSAPMALVVLAENGLIDPPDVGALASARSKLYGAMAGAAGYPSAQGEIASMAPAPELDLPSCRAEETDVVDGGRAARVDMGSSNATLIEQAIPLAYAGSRLVLGDHAYLVDAGGRPEQIQIQHIERDDDADVFAIGIYFPRRASVALERLKAFGTRPPCSAPAEMILVRRGEDGLPAEVRRFIPDTEAPVSHISLLQWIPSDDGRAALAITYSASYGSERWYGEIEWQATIGSDPPRVMVRTPVVYGKRPRAGDESAGLVTVTRRAADALELSTIDMNGRLATQAVRVPLGPGGRLSGVTLLEQF